MIAALALGVFTLGAGALPLYYTMQMKQDRQSLTTTKGALHKQDVIRGAFANSGSKDIGPEFVIIPFVRDVQNARGTNNIVFSPDWDFEKRTWRGKPIGSKRATESP